MPSNLNTPFDIYQKVHFIGIGGIGISALARILQQLGHQVTGSDQSKSNNTVSLEKEGIKVHYSHSKEHLDQDCQLVIHTIAIPENNPELLAAKERNCQILTYPQALGLLTKKLFTIAISGTHGKTTTTAMTGLALLDAQIDPSIIVGSLIPQLDNKNERVGHTKYLVIEACEYQESFLHYHPDILVLNNIDPEHFDYFKNEKNYLDAFHKYLQCLKPNGIAIVNGDDQNVKTLIKNNPQIKFIKFGNNPDNDFILNKNFINNKYQLNLLIPGNHNLLNATAAFAVSQTIGLNPEKTLASLNNYQGANRRFELKGQIMNKDIIDDYGHTPTEIQATLQAVKQKYGENSKILCIFQPHQYSRTFLFLEEFSKSFNHCHRVFIPNIYASRDSKEDIEKINVQALVDKINTVKNDLAVNTLSFENTLDLTKKSISEFDVVLIIGAGDITKLADQLSNFN